MTRLKKILIGLGAAIAVIGIGAGVSSAMVANQVISGVTNKSIYKTAQTITITGTVNGDIFCAAQTVDIDATVNGDILCAGQSVTVNGTVHGSVRLAGQTVNLNAKVDDNASIAAQQVNLDTEASVGKDVGLFAQTAIVSSSVGRDIQATVDSLSLNGFVGRDVNAWVNKLNLQSFAKISRNLTYKSPNKLTQTTASKVGGTVYYTYSQPSHHASWAGTILLFQIFLLLAFLILGLALVALFPQKFVKWNALASEKIWAVLATGIVAMIFVPVLLTVLLITVLGIPLAVFLGAVWLIALMLSAPISAFYVGRIVLTGRQSALLVLLVGSIILGVVSLVPILGELVILIASWLGTGTLILSLKDKFKSPNYTVS